MHNVFRALRFFRPDAPHIAAALSFLALAAGAGLLKPWPLAIIVDSVLGGKPLPRWVDWASDWPMHELLPLLGVAIFILHAAQGAFTAAQNYVSIRAGLRGLVRVRNALFSRLQRLSLRFHQTSNQGDVIYRASWDTYAFQTLFQQGLFTLIQASLGLLLMLVVMWQVNQRLTYVALSIVPVLFAIMSSFGRQMKRRSLAAHQADSRVTSAFQQNIVAMPVVQSNTREADEADRFAGKASVAFDKRTSQHGLEVLYWFAIAMAFGMAAAAVTWAGALEVTAQRLTVGELLIFLAYLTQLYDPLNQLSHVGATVSEAGAGIQRVFELLDADDEVRERTNARPVSAAAPDIRKPSYRPAMGVAARPADADGLGPLVVRGEIEFIDVSFAYEIDRLVLTDVTLRVPARTSAALIGPSGAGKTTLLQLLPRFYDPSGGSIQLDGADLRDLKVPDLRRQIAVVWQEPLLLPGTVAENIAYGRPDATRAEIESAARAAHAHEFITRLPREYETPIGEGGTRLSAGEKQRVNIARAFLKNAPMIVLDEPTSALDAESEAMVMDGLSELMRGRTALLVAHRLSTIRRVDQVLVLENGRLTQQGRHEELMRQQGYYARAIGKGGVLT